MNKLVKPILYDGKEITHYDLKQLTIGTLNEVSKKKEASGAIRELVNRSVASFVSVDSSVFSSDTDVYKIISLLGYKTIEEIVFRIVRDSQDDTGIDGVYVCPRCGESQEQIDFLEDIDIRYVESLNNEYKIELEKALEIVSKDGKEVVTDFIIRMPTIVDMEKARGDQSRLYSYCLVKVNEEIIARQWIDVFGKRLFDAIPIKEKGFKEFTKEIQSMGLDIDRETECSNCGKTFNYKMNLANFFASALQQE